MTAHTFPPLSLDDIHAAMSTSAHNQLDEILVKDSVTSTNDVLWQRLDKGKYSPAVCLSENQTAGRGRRGDLWHSPATGNLYLSIFWPFPANMTKTGLSIAIGISLINTLESLGINGLQLKWPNDVLHKKHKLAGILVESRFGKKRNTVIGIGLNFKLPTATQALIQQPTTSLQQLCTHAPCRNQLAGKIIQNMIETLQHFQRHGLTSFITKWPQYDALHNKMITLSSDTEQFTALAQGINEQGELRYLREDKIYTLSNSHVSIRLAS